MSNGWRPLTDAEESKLDHLAAHSPQNGFMQSAAWAQFKRAEGYQVTRLAYQQDEALIGGASLLRFHPDGQPNFVLCPEGPILPWEDAATARQALRELVAFTKETPNALGLRIEPHIPRPLPSLLRNWADAPTDLTPADTILLDLTQTEEELLAQAHPKCRYNLRIADREGIQVQTTQDPGAILDFYPLLQETSARNGFFCEPLGFFLNLVTTLFPQNAAELVTARHQDKLLAALIVVYFGRRATYLYGASSSSQRNKMPAYPLHRQAMRAARERGCTEYDLYGIDAFERPGHLYAGITRFKKQWGGVVHQRIGARDYVFYDRLAELIVQRAELLPNL